MQTYFLTSDFPNGFPEAFITALKQTIVRQEHFVFTASSFDKAEVNEKYARKIMDMFAAAGFHFQTLTILDDRLPLAQIDQVLEQADVIWLAGGDTLSQHASFERIGLREKLKTTTAVLIGMSAGAINMGDQIVLARHELDNVPELTQYHGLGLVPMNLEPHFNLASAQHREEIRQASRIAPILALCDDAFVQVTGGKIQIVGEYQIFDETRNKNS